MCDDGFAALVTMSKDKTQYIFNDRLLEIALACAYRLLYIKFNHIYIYLLVSGLLRIERGSKIQRSK